MSDVKGLVERLRRKVTLYRMSNDTCDGEMAITADGDHLANPDGPEAADALEAQAARLEAAEAIIREAQVLLDRVEHRSKRGDWKTSGDDSKALHYLDKALAAYRALDGAGR